MLKAALPSGPLLQNTARVPVIMAASPMELVAIAGVVFLTPWVKPFGF
jgi:hypothetical protein